MLLTNVKVKLSNKRKKNIFMNLREILDLKTTDVRSKLTCT